MAGELRGSKGVLRTFASDGVDTIAVSDLLQAAWPLFMFLFTCS